MLSSVLLAPAACDLPTALTRVESRFVVPGETTTLAVDELLPPSITSVGGSFSVALGARDVGPRTVAQLCGAPCAGLEGQRVPKPAFTDTIPVRIPFPGELASATLASGTVAGTLTRTVQLAPGETRQRLEFTGAELRSLLGREVTVALSGTVDAPAPVALRPGQAVTIATLLELVVETGPEG